MYTEIETAISFLASFLKSRYNSETIGAFKEQLHDVLVQTYVSHWHPSFPLQGSGYRAIRFTAVKLDTNVVAAATLVNSLAYSNTNNNIQEISPAELYRLYPKELIVWVDPCSVAYRIGDHGSIGSLYDEPVDAQNNQSRSSSPVLSAPHNRLNANDNSMKPFTIAPSKITITAV